MTSDLPDRLPTRAQVHADPNHQETTMPDLDLTDLLDPDLTIDQINAALIAKLGLPACKELWDRAEYAAMQAAHLSLVRERDRVVAQVLGRMVDQHFADWPTR